MTLHASIKEGLTWVHAAGVTLLIAYGVLCVPIYVMVATSLSR